MKFIFYKKCAVRFCIIYIKYKIFFVLTFDFYMIFDYTFCTNINYIYFLYVLLVLVVQYVLFG